MNVPAADLAAIGARVRNARERAGIKSLERFADAIKDAGCKRPSIAKLSRIETGEHPVSLDILPTISQITRIPSRELRPDLIPVAEQILGAAQ